MGSDKEETEPRYYGLENGVVLDNADPEKLGRVKLRVPGICEESAWAFPAVVPGGGSAQRGTYDVPAVGAELSVWFYRGDPQHPRWAASHWGKPGGKSEAPTPIHDPDVEPGEAVRIKVYETDRFLVTYDERTGKESLRLALKGVDDLFIEIDSHALAVEIAGTSAVKIRSMGQVAIEGTDISIGGRKLVQNGKPIQ